MLTAAAPVHDLDLGFGVINSLPASYEARRGAEHAAQGFLPGMLSPTVVLVEGRDLSDRRAELARFEGAGPWHFSSFNAFPRFSPELM
ncbi:MAG: hypothetical protein M3144_11850 [Actinomycetota bacterium]|nr:hypothetical protein [Actinomycetota bacterium]